MLALVGGEGIKEIYASLGTGGILVYVAPFAILLLCIAVLPLFAHHWWESNKHKAIISLVLGLPIGAIILYQDWHTMLHVALDYGAFIALLGALFIISGGIYIRGSFAGTPIVNTFFLLIGALLANFIGTTGASMLLIRPLLRANRRRQRKVHIIVFFIFIVSNCAGLLTPLGDPPLFLGFLNGIPFAWTFQLWLPWLTVVGALLVIFNLVDQYQFNKEDVETKGSLIEDVTKSAEKFGIEGKPNLMFLLAIVGIILFSGYVIYPSYGDLPSKIAQMIGMSLVALISYKSTSPALRERNGFSFGPIVEVAVLFAGIFMAMVPALLILETQGKNLGVTEPWQYFWMTGSLSSFLDNAPTYLTFTSLAKGAYDYQQAGLAQLIQPASATTLAAISCGAVFMGANTYIGNGPNFMVKAIAEEAKIKMPSFFGFMVWSIAILIPIFVLVTFLFFRG
jgi:Na+/H+ antiporter NhaD/arsenite permease-like protein